MTGMGDVPGICNVLRALADPVRLDAVRRLADGRPRSCAAIMPTVARPTASHHLKILEDAGVIHRRRAGTRVLNTLARREMDREFPGLLAAVLGGAA